jgi:hypothetical protein
MDNYFNSVALFNHLYNHRYGACGTARPTSGLPLLLQELREHAKGLSWGTLYALPVSNVLCLAWQDNNIVLGLSTLHSADSFVSCKRRRPGKTSTNGAIARRVFGKEVIKELEIPIFINDYNYYMNGVDLANQYRSSYEVHLKGYRNWLPLLYFFINAAIINAWRIQYLYKQQHGAIRLPAQLFFREKLYQQLLAFASQVNTGLPVERLTLDPNHCRIPLEKRVPCVWCQYKRKIGHLNTSRAPRSASGCLKCGKVALCLKTRCWQEFHSIEKLGG